MEAEASTCDMTGVLGLTPGVGLYNETRQPPAAASARPSTNCQGSLSQPPAGGCNDREYKALTTGAPAKTIDITTAGVPLAPKASNTPKAPAAPTMPATRDHPRSAQRKTPCCPVDHQHRQRRQHGSNEVGNAHDEKGFVTAVNRVVHGSLAAMEEYAVKAPTYHGG